MDEHIVRYETLLRIHEDAEDMSSYYALRSKAAERGWCAYLDEGSQFKKATQGRGNVTFITKKPGRPKEVAEVELATIRNEHGRRAVTALKQARRMEQVAHRLGLIMKMSSDESIST